MLELEHSFKLRVLHVIQSWLSTLKYYCMQLKKKLFKWQVLLGIPQALIYSCPRSRKQDSKLSGSLQVHILQRTRHLKARCTLGLIKTQPLDTVTSSSNPTPHIHLSCPYLPLSTTSKSLGHRPQITVWFWTLACPINYYLSNFHVRFNLSVSVYYT